MYLPFFQFCKGLLEYRRADFTSAGEWTVKSLNKNRIVVNIGSLPAEDYALLAMADFQLARPDLARSALAESTELARRDSEHRPSGDLGSDWKDWLIVQCLINEAKGLILSPSESSAGSALPEASASLLRRAQELSEAGKLADAEELYRRAVRQTSELLGKEHTLVVRVMLGLGRILQSQGNFGEAAIICHQAEPPAGSQSAIGEKQPKSE